MQLYHKIYFKNTQGEVYTSFDKCIFIALFEKIEFANQLLQDIIIIIIIKKGRQCKAERE